MFQESLGTRILLCSAGYVSQDSVKRFILEQEGRDVFDYSIYGDTTGQSKIGIFTK